MYCYRVLGAKRTVFNLIHLFLRLSTASGYQWKSCVPPWAPDGAIEAGTDIDGNAIYVGRAKHNGHWIPAKAVCSKGVAYVPYGGKEHAKNANEYEAKHLDFFLLKTSSLLSIALFTVFRIYIRCRFWW